MGKDFRNILHSLIRIFNGVRFDKKIFKKADNLVNFTVNVSFNLLEKKRRMGGDKAGLTLVVLDSECYKLFECNLISAIVIHSLDIAPVSMFRDLYFVECFEINFKVILLPFFFAFFIGF